TVILLTTIVMVSFYTINAADAQANATNSTGGGVANNMTNSTGGGVANNMSNGTIKDNSCGQEMNREVC
ncbi:MAG: hypothetical protein ACTHKC_01780, partial [Candidatus Nitrosocosmicus sp.]